METVSNRIIEGESLVIDNKHFVGCTLINCILEYSGDDVVFDRTEMRGCRYVFFGRARRTIHFLQGTGLMPHAPAEWGEFPGTVQ